MNSRKRQASESLLPVRSAKYHRTSNDRFSSNSSEDRSLLARWLDLGREAWELGIETLTRIWPGPDRISSPFPSPRSPPQIYRSSDPGNRRPQSARYKARHISDTASPLSPRMPTTNMKSSAGGTPRTPPAPQAPSSILRHPNMTNELSEATRATRLSESSTQYLHQHASTADPTALTKTMPVSRAAVVRPPRSQQTESSALSKSRRTNVSSAMDPSLISDKAPPGADEKLLNAITPAPVIQPRDVLDEALANANKRQTKTSLPYKSREHILAKQHKAQVLAERKKDQEEMVKQEYRKRRSSGYAADLQTFEGLLFYKDHLELEKDQNSGEAQNLRSPSASLTDLRTTAISPVQSRRHSDTFMDKHDQFLIRTIRKPFFDRAVQKARDALNGPKPPKPFVPSIEQMRVNQVARNREIERRLRTPKLPGCLPPQDDAQVDAILDTSGVICRFRREQVTDIDMARLRPAQWLNDEVINYYGALLQARSDAAKENSRASSQPLDIHYFSTFFWTKLREDGYEKGRLSKWTKRFDIFKKDAVLMPINHSNSHWTAASINFRRKRIESYDSMGVPRPAIFKLLRTYLDEEHRNKKGSPFDFTGWEDYVMPDIPLQENCYDCGVFTCQYLERLSRGEESFNFSQDNMPYLRRRMVWEIGKAILRSD